MLHSLSRRQVLAFMLASVLVATAGIRWNLSANDARVLRDNLRLSELPSSVSGVRCTSPETTDVITDCYLSISPEDFERLLKGWSFTKHAPDVFRNGQSFTSAGTAFPVAYIYSANVSSDPEFKHGGHFLLYVSADRSRVRTSLYIE
jgi:hypothetical protein